jgi:hypothetical protein
MKKLKTFESFLNERFSDNIAYIEAVKILKTLHGFSNKIKFKTENVNGYENIVYDDENLISKECLDKLKDSRFWNTEFASRIGIFSNNRINIGFEKSAQDILNIKDFDKKEWKPGNY